jgi:PII-like signaling protein
MLLIFIDEDDTFETMPLSEAIVRRLRKRDIAGATVLRGIMGYGAQHRIYGSGTLGIPENRPVTILVVEAEEKLLAVLPEISAMVKEGLVVTMDAHVHKYAAGSPSRGG